MSRCHPLKVYVFFLFLSFAYFNLILSFSQSSFNIPEKSTGFQFQPVCLPFYQIIKLSALCVCSPSRQCQDHHPAVWESHWGGRGGRWGCRHAAALLQQPRRWQHWWGLLKYTCIIFTISCRFGADSVKTFSLRILPQPNRLGASGT